MADKGISMPSGFGGLMRYKEEYESKFNLKPAHVVIFIILMLPKKIKRIEIGRYKRKREL